MSAHATLIVCDDIRFEANGKFIVIGGYTGDIAIAASRDYAPQMLFLFSVDSPLVGFPRRMEFSVTLPGHPPDISIHDVSDFVADPAIPRWTYRHIVHVRNRALYPGKIAARVICDTQVIDVFAPNVSISLPEISD